MNAIDTAFGAATPSDPTKPIVTAYEIAAILMHADSNNYDDPEWKLNLQDDVWRMAREIVRLRHRLGENDLSQLADHFCWGEESHAYFCIEDATPDPKFRSFLEAFLERTYNGDGSINISDIAQRAGVTAEEAERYARELVAVRMITAHESQQ